MKLNRRTFALLFAGVLSLCAADAFGGVPPLPPGARPPAGWAWCSRCEGRRYVPSGFLGWTSKPCPNCNGYGMVKLPPPPPPPKPVVVVPQQPHRHHKPAPAVHHKPVQHRVEPNAHRHRSGHEGPQHRDRRPGQQPRR